MKLVKISDPYERGYWARYHEKPKPKGPVKAREGWEDCKRELAAEARAKSKRK